MITSISLRSQSNVNVRLRKNIDIDVESKTKMCTSGAPFLGVELFGSLLQANGFQNGYQRTIFLLTVVCIFDCVKIYMCCWQFSIRTKHRICRKPAGRRDRHQLAANRQSTFARLQTPASSDTCNARRFVAVHGFGRL